jgi:hypothetical protein
MFEPAIKVKLIDFLLNNHQKEGILLVNEMAFADGSRRADLVTISDNLVAYEIKSEKDSLEKLPEQLRDYDNHFHSVYVVCHNKHLKNIRKIKGKFGILVISSQGFIQIRKARNKKRIMSRYLLDHLDKRSLMSTIKRQLPSIRSTRNASTNELRSILRDNITNRALCLAVLEHLKNKHQASNDQFVSERGKITIEDDLLLLNKSSHTISS